jgi:pimeloyl-ACP methyl ester carboxylesterase
VTVPVLMVHGDLDPSILTATVDGSDRYVTGPLRRHVVAGAGHFVPEERPGELTDVLLDWLAADLPG